MKQYLIKYSIGKSKRFKYISYEMKNGIYIFLLAHLTFLVDFIYDDLLHFVFDKSPTYVRRLLEELLRVLTHYLSQQKITLCPQFKKGLRPAYSVFFHFKLNVYFQEYLKRVGPF